MLDYQLLKQFHEFLVLAWETSTFLCFWSRQPGKGWYALKRSSCKVTSYHCEHTHFSWGRMANTTVLVTHRSLSPWDSMVNLASKSGCPMTWKIWKATHLFLCFSKDLSQEKMEGLKICLWCTLEIKMWVLLEHFSYIKTEYSFWDAWEHCHCHWHSRRKFHPRINKRHHLWWSHKETLSITDWYLLAGLEASPDGLTHGHHVRTHEHTHAWGYRSSSLPTHRAAVSGFMDTDSFSPQTLFSCLEYPAPALPQVCEVVAVCVWGSEQRKPLLPN